MAGRSIRRFAQLAVICGKDIRFREKARACHEAQLQRLPNYRAMEKAGQKAEPFATFLAPGSAISGRSQRHAEARKGVKSGHVDYSPLVVDP